MKIKWLASLLFPRLKRLAEARGPDFIIGSEADPYMLRWYLIPRNRWLNVYLHHILRDDEDRALHDHPWASMSLCLHGEVGEVYGDWDGQCTRVARAGSLVYRSSRFAHRLFLPDGPAWTIFITGPRIREWGFWCPRESPAGGWRHWKEFTAFREVGEDGKGRIGRGCD
jgi:hypothetical protein